MKKLFSIALVIAMALSCLAIFPSAATENIFSADSSLTVKIDFLNGNKQAAVTLTLDLGIEQLGLIDTGAMEIWLLYDEAQLAPHSTDTIVWEGTGADDYAEAFWAQDGSLEGACYFDTPVTTLPYRNVFKVTYFFDVLAAPGETITITDDVTKAAYDSEFFITTPVVSAVVPADAPAYEAPASAMAQELLGCDACGVDAGVRFIAKANAAADEYGMYITANGKTYTLTSAAADFNVKSSDNGVDTFTAVIFSDLSFEVVVFEKYGDVEVKSDAVRN